MKRKRTGSPVTTKKKRVKTTGDYQKGRELAKTPKQELKAFDIADTSTTVEPVGNPPNFVCLNACVNGAELYQRVGRKIYMKSVQIRGVFKPNAATSVSSTGRLIIFYDSQPNAGAPTIVQLLQDSNTAAATTWDSNINLANRQRFKILRDYPFYLGNATAANEVGNNAILDTINYSIQLDPKHFFIKLNGLEAIYNATNGGTFADITSGSLWLVTVGDAQSGNWNLDFSSRLRYYD